MFDVVAHGQQTHCRRTSGCREQNHAASRARLGASERGLRGGVLARDRGPGKGCWLPAASRACPAQVRVDAPRHGRGKVGSEHVDRPSSRAHSRRVYPRAACEHWGHGRGKTAVGTCIRTGGTLPAKPGALEFPDVTSLPAAIFSHHFFSRARPTDCGRPRARPVLGSPVRGQVGQSLLKGSRCRASSSIFEPQTGSWPQRTWPPHEPRYYSSRGSQVSIIKHCPPS